MTMNPLRMPDTQTTFYLNARQREALETILLDSDDPWSRELLQELEAADYEVERVDD